MGRSPKNGNPAGAGHRAPPGPAPQTPEGLGVTAPGAGLCPDPPSARGAGIPPAPEGAEGAGRVSLAHLGGRPDVPALITPAEGAAA